MAYIHKARWKVLSPLLDQLLDVEPGERAARLDQIRSDDHVLARELEALLAAMVAADREAFLESSVLDTLEGETGDSDTDEDVVGPSTSGRAPR